MSMFGDIKVAARNGIKRAIRARQAHAQEYVNGALLTLDDETLAQHGYKRSDLSARKHNRVPWM